MGKTYFWVTALYFLRHPALWGALGIADVAASIYTFVNGDSFGAFLWALLGALSWANAIMSARKFGIN